MKGAADLILRARIIMGQWDKLHLLSVRIGELQSIADSGVLQAEIRGARMLVESADRLCADIDKAVLESAGEKLSNGDESGGGPT